MSYQGMRRDGRNICIWLSEGSQSGKATYQYDSNCMAYWKSQNYRDNIKRLVASRGLG